MAIFTGTNSDDLFFGTDDADTITGGSGNDRLYALGGDDTLEGDAGRDILDGGAGIDTMRGGADSDWYIVDNVSDQVIEDAGGGTDDFIYTYIDFTLPANVERIAVYSRTSTYAINLTGNELNNELIGNDADNILDGGAGSDIFQGAGGNDTYIVDQAGDRAVEHQNSGTDTILVDMVTGNTLHATFDYSLAPPRGTNPTNPQLVSHIERLGVRDVTTTNSVNLVGGNNANEIWGNNGINVIDGEAGNDIMRGHGGDDFYFVFDAGDQVIEEDGEGYDTVYIGFSRNGFLSNGTCTLTANVERLVAGGGTLTGNALDNEISATGTSNDLIDGGLGADLMMGGAGNDTYLVDNAGDQVGERSNEGADTVRTSVDFTLGSNLENLQAFDAAGTGGLQLTGNELANQITGDAGANDIDGRGGVDILIGRDGDDRYFLDNSGDVIVESVGGGYDTAYVNGANYTLGANVDRLIAADSTSPQNLTGNDIDNEISANAGTNVLDGKGGRDILYGYGGADTFIFTSALVTYANVDQLPDYEAGIDRIGLDDAVFLGLQAGQLSTDAFRLGSEALDADDRILYDPATGFIYFDEDGTGGGRGPVLFAVVHEGTTITSDDFFVF